MRSRQDQRELWFGFGSSILLSSYCASQQGLTESSLHTLGLMLKSHTLSAWRHTSHTYTCVLSALVSSHCLGRALFYCSLSTFTHATLSLRACFLPSLCLKFPSSLDVWPSFSHPSGLGLNITHPEKPFTPLSLGYILLCVPPTPEFFF